MQWEVLQQHKPEKQDSGLVDITHRKNTSSFGIYNILFILYFAALEEACAFTQDCFKLQHFLSDESGLQWHNQLIITGPF